MPSNRRKREEQEDSSNLSLLPEDQQERRPQQTKERQHKDVVVLNEALLLLRLLGLNHLPPTLVLEHFHGGVEALLVLLSPPRDVDVVAGVEVVVEAVAQLAHATRQHRFPIASPDVVSGRGRKGRRVSPFVGELGLMVGNVC